MFQLILTIILIGGAGYGGYSISEYQWNQREVHRLVSEKEARAAQEKLDADASAAHADTVLLLNKTILNLRKQIGRKKDADYQTKDVQHPFTIGFVRDYNSLSVGAMSADAANSNGSVETDSRIANVTRTAVLDNHAEQMTLCREWKSQLDSIIMWDSKTFEGR